jgi:hypothetical protein
MKTWIRLLAVALAAALAAPGVMAQDTKQAPQAAPATQAQAGPRHEDVMVSMRDGVELATTVYFPAGDGPWPTVVSRTPYNKGGMAKGASRYTNAGYVYVGQDVRGRFLSKGEYVPFAPDREDGYDTIAWVNKQKFCDGNIGITGGSALGITSNLAASANPPGLKAAYVVVAPQSQFLESNFIGGVFKESMIAGWMKGQASEGMVPMLRARVKMDEGWKRTDFVNYMQNVNIPIYNVGGWYDIFGKGSVSNFMYLQEKGKGKARGNQKLLMGPFGHGSLAGDLDYGDTGIMAAMNNDLRWFDYWLKGEKNGIMDEPAVTYYMMASARKGALSDKNHYVKSTVWPPKAKSTKFYLEAKGGLGTTAPTGADAPIVYAFDPKNPAPTFGGSNLIGDKGPMDQRAVGDRADYLRFQTGPLADDVAIAGPVTMELYAATDGPDTDFMVKLVDVYPDGYEAIVLDNPIRARFRYGRERADEELMTPGVPAKFTIDLWNTAITFEKGHRIAVHVTSSNFPRFDVNPNTGVPAMESRVATNSIYHDAQRPSAIILPLIAAKAGQDTDD